MSPPPSAAILVPPYGADAALAAGWTPAEARAAVDAHKRGEFRWSWQLTIDCPSYPPIRAALEQRLASPCGLPWTVDGPTRAPGRHEVEAARALWAAHLARLVRSTLRDVALMGFSIWYHPLTIAEDTLRAQVADYLPPGESTEPWPVPVGGVSRWPLSAVGYTAYPTAGVVGYYAIAQGGQRVQLPRPGTTSGPWTVIGEGDQPHLDGAIVALDMAYTAGMLAWRARSNLGKAAGRASPFAVLPERVAVESAEGQAAQEVVRGLGTEQTGAVLPHGTALDKFELTTTGAADYFHRDLLDSILVVALAIMGRGSALAKTDAQYVGPTEMDIPEELVRRDVRVLERAATGLFREIGRLNGSDADVRLNGHHPDVDQAERRKAEDEESDRAADRLAKLHAALATEMAAGYAVDELRVAELAEIHRVPPPRVK